MSTTLHVRPIGPALGAEVAAVDLARPQSAETYAGIEAALAEHAVLVFREQRLDAAALDGFARRLGRPQRHVLERYRHPEIPEISFITNVDAEGRTDPFGVRRATIWHTDATYEDHLPRAAMLHALEVPSAGGGTLFADMRAAWDALDAATRGRLDGLVGLHRFNAGPAGSAGIYAGQAGTERDFEDRHWPAVMTHPVSGRRILFVNPAHTHGFAGVDTDEGARLVEALTAHATAERFVYYHTWRVGDLVIWDELATMHRGGGDSDPSERRVMMRSIVYPD